jgi:hypothetical protein
MMSGYAATVGMYVAVLVVSEDSSDEEDDEQDKEQALM